MIPGEKLPRSLHHLHAHRADNSAVAKRRATEIGGRPKSSRNCPPRSTILFFRVVLSGIPHKVSSVIITRWRKSTFSESPSVKDWAFSQNPFMVLCLRPGQFQWIQRWYLQASALEDFHVSTTPATNIGEGRHLAHEFAALFAQGAILVPLACKLMFSLRYREKEKGDGIDIEKRRAKY